MNSRFLLAFRLDKSSLARKFYKGYALILARPAGAPKTPLEFGILARNDGITAITAI